jgi:hypothetical protein
MKANQFEEGDRRATSMVEEQLIGFQCHHIIWAGQCVCTVDALLSIPPVCADMFCNSSQWRRHAWTGVRSRAKSSLSKALAGHNAAQPTRYL